MDRGAFVKKIFRWRYIGLTAAAVAAVGIIYLLVSTLHVAAGITREVDTPDHLVRLQVVNGSGTVGLERVVAERLNHLTDAQLAVVIVREERFDKTDLPETFVVSRSPDLAAARLLARTIGLDPGKVSYEPLAHNSRQISATLILGADFEQTDLYEFVNTEDE